MQSSEITTNRYVSDRWRYYSAYAQDDWRLNDKLTVNYGRAVRIHAADLGRAITPTDTRTSTRTCRTRPPAAGSARLNSPEKGRDGREKRRCTRRGRGASAHESGAVYSVDANTVARFSAARTFGSVKNTGGSSHWNGFIGGYNVTAPAFPASSAFNWDGGWPAWPEPPFLVPETLNGSNIPYWQPEDAGRLPEYHSWTMNVQRQLPGRFMVEAGYNAQIGRHLTANLLSLNQVDPAIFNGFVRQYGPAGAINLMNSRMDSTLARQAGIPYPYPQFSGAQPVRQALRPYPQYLDINTGADGGDRSGRSSYHAFVLRGEKRYDAGLTFMTSYVWSKSMTLRSDRANAGDGRAMNHYNREIDYGLSAFDQTHSIKLNYSYELPFGPGKPFVQDGVMSKIAGGWRISGVHSYASGFALSVGPGYGLPLFGGDNRLTVLDETGWRAATRGDNFDPLVDLWWDPALFNRTPVDTVAQLQGYKAGVLTAEFGNATGAQSERTQPVVPQREHLDRAHVRPAEDEPRIPVRSVQPAQSHDLGQPGFDDHERKLRSRDDTEQRAAADAARIEAGISEVKGDTHAPHLCVRSRDRVRVFLPSSPHSRASHRHHQRIRTGPGCGHGARRHRYR